MVLTYFAVKRNVTYDIVFSKLAFEIALGYEDYDHWRYIVNCLLYGNLKKPKTSQKN